MVKIKWTVCENKTVPITFYTLQKCSFSILLYFGELHHPVTQGGTPEVPYSPVMHTYPVHHQTCQFYLLSILRIHPLLSIRIIISLVQASVIPHWPEAVHDSCHGPLPGLYVSCNQNNPT